MADPAAVVEAEKVLERPYDTADPQQVNTARKKAARKDRERLDVVRGLMTLPEGRAWLYGLLDRCHIFENVFVPGQPDATGFRCGERNVGLSVLADIMAVAPDEYATMCKEAKSS